MYLLRGCILTTPRDTATKPTDPNDSLFFAAALDRLSLLSIMKVGGLAVGDALEGATWKTAPRLTTATG